MTCMIEVNGMRLHGHHGVMEQERTVGNEFEVTAHLSVEVPPSGTDDIALTVSYADIAEIIKEVMAEPCNLLETVAGRIRTRLTERWPGATGGMVRVAKLTPPIPGTQMADAAVRLEW